jgi:hypothetical protein
VRTSIAATITILAVVLVWGALVAPDQPNGLTLGAFVRLPLEGLVLVALALALPPSARPVLAWVVGPTLGLLVIVKILDIGFLATFDRPVDLASDWSYTGIGIETLRDSVGRTEANLAVAGAAVLIVAVLVLTTLAVLRLTRVSAGHRRRSLQAVVALGLVWVLCWAFGARLVPQAPVASASTADLAFEKIRAVRTALQDPAVFADEIGQDRFRETPGYRLLTGLRGKDVIVAFVESYGRVAVEDASVAPPVNAVLDEGTKRLRAAGFLRPERLPHVADVRRGQLAGALHPAFGGVGRQPATLRPARRERPLHAQPGVQASRLADGRRRAGEQPRLAAGVVVLPLRQDLRPA